MLTNIQGEHACIKVFVFNELPDIFKSVNESHQAKNLENGINLPVNARVKLAAETIYTCDVCAKKFIRKAFFKKHIQTKHVESIIKSPVSKVRRNDIVPPIMISNLNGTPQVSLIDITEDPKPDASKVSCVEEEAVTLEETPDIIEEEVGPHNMSQNWQCGECGSIHTSDEELKNHMETVHNDTLEDISRVSETTSDNCTECKTKDETNQTLRVTLTDKATENNTMEKELDTLRRRHDQLKQKYDDMNKDNKKYAKNLIEALKENTLLKENAKKDVETLEDALNMNQVLIEEIKVKDATINADKTSRKNADDIEENPPTPYNNSIRCSICDWKSDNPSQLPGHMTKHVAGQYICEKCNVRHMTKQKLNEHMKDCHKKQMENEQGNGNCNICDKVFANPHSLKQHNTSKHNSSSKLPLGHPDQAKEKNNSEPKSAHIACVQCGKRFSCGREIDEHMREHRDEAVNGEFEEYKNNRICRYFRRGTCTRGQQCRFSHNIENQTRQFTPRCTKGESCFFLQQNRCSFFHPGVGVQRPRTEPGASTNPNQGFQFAQRMNRPPIGAKQMNMWKNY